MSIIRIQNETFIFSLLLIRLTNTRQNIQNIHPWNWHLLILRVFYNISFIMWQKACSIVGLWKSSLCPEILQQNWACSITIQCVLTFQACLFLYFYLLSYWKHACCLLKRNLHCKKINVYYSCPFTSWKKTITGVKLKACLHVMSNCKVTVKLYCVFGNGGGHFDDKQYGSWSHIACRMPTTIGTSNLIAWRRWRHV